MAGKEKMEERVRITRGSDWCTVQIAKECLTYSGSTDQCWLLGDQIRICPECVKDLSKDSFPEDYAWRLRSMRHEGPCEEYLVSFGSEEVSICPGCVYKVLDELARSCDCSCHETGGMCDAHPFCAKCGVLVKIDVIYMTRQQTERHPKKSE